MHKRTYVVPHHGVGEVQHVAVQGLNLDALVAPLSLDPSTQRRVTISRSSEGTWQVLDQGHEIGHLSSQEEDRYKEFEWLFDSGITVQATLDLETGSLLLPAPGLCLPSNNPPASAWVMLTPGPTITLDRLPEGLQLDAPAHVLVSLRRGSDSVSVFLGQQLVGIIPARTAVSLQQALAECSERGLVAVTHAFYSGDTLELSPGELPAVLPPKPLDVHPTPQRSAASHSPARPAAVPQAQAPRRDESTALSNRWCFALTASVAAASILIAGIVGFACNQTFFSKDDAPVNFSATHNGGEEEDSEKSQTSPKQDMIIYRDMAEYRKAVGDMPAAAQHDSEQH